MNKELEAKFNKLNDDLQKLITKRQHLWDLCREIRNLEHNDWDGLIESFRELSMYLRYWEFNKIQEMLDDFIWYLAGGITGEMNRISDESGIKLTIEPFDISKYKDNNND